ncbi:MAG TPA: metallophosphoesterase [Candidatus Magasanikbacteria bacterium]|nr:metallophosphoesterase [Candidatus Magasanikbacteria bacterium]
MKPVYYDSIIGGGIVLGLVAWLGFLLSIPILSVFSLIAVIVLIWGSFIEPKIIETSYVPIHISKVHHEFTIAVLTDLHAGPYKKTDFFERVVEETMKLNPDMVVLVGDHTFNCVPNQEEVQYLTPLKKLTEKYPVYAVHGNHEYGLSDHLGTNPTQKRYADVSEHTKKTLQSYGVTYLQNQILKLKVKNQELYLFGGDEVWANSLNYSSLATRNTDFPLIALIHNPVYLYHPHPSGIDLTISGHTHGGQLRLPYIGPLAKPDAIIPKKLYQGLHEPERKGEYLFVSRGLGESEPRARLFCIPEITLLTISGQKASESSNQQTT